MLYVFHLAPLFFIFSASHLFYAHSRERTVQSRFSWTLCARCFRPNFVKRPNYATGDRRISGEPTAAPRRYLTSIIELDVTFYALVKHKRLKSHRVDRHRRCRSLSMAVRECRKIDTKLNSRVSLVVLSATFYHATHLTSPESPDVRSIRTGTGIKLK